MPSDLERARALIVEHRRTSVAFLKQQLMLSENKIQRLLRELEREGVISAVGPGGVRTILV